MSNDDIAKDLTPKPGSRYYLEPTPEARLLALATPKDESDLLSVDSYYCHLKVKTIVLGYITGPSMAETAVESSAAAIASGSVEAQTDNATVKTLEGFLRPTTGAEKRRLELGFKIEDEKGKTLAFIDSTSLPKITSPGDYVHVKVLATGKLAPTDDGEDLILKAATLQKAR